MKAKLVFLVLLISCIPLYSQQKVNATLEKQEKMIQQLQTENQTLKDDLSQLEKEVGIYRNEVMATRSDLNGDMSNWLTTLSIIMGAIGLILGGALPVLLNVWFDKNQDKKLESIQAEAKEASSQALTAKEKAEQAEKALNEIQQLKDSISKIEEKVSASSLATKEAANQAMASEWYSEAISEEDPSQAIKLINRVIKLYPDLAKAYNRRGIIYAKMNKLYDAKKDFEKAIEISSTDAVYHYNLGKTLTLIGMSEHAEELLNKAIESFDRAIEFNASYSEAYCYRGVVNKRLKHYEESLRDYNKAIELSPEKPLYYKNRARCYEAMANAETDVELKEKYLSKAKEDRVKVEFLSKKDEDDSSPKDIEH